MSEMLKDRAAAALHWAVIAAVILIGNSGDANAATLPPGFDVNSLLPAGFSANPIIRTIGLGLDHRPYQSATPLGTTIGLDVGVEATGATIPVDFVTMLAQLGSAAGAL